MGEISAIIVSWNACGFLRNCLNSIRKTAGFVVCEVVVVDNASTDGSPEMVEEEFPEVKLVRAGENLGFAKANNLGIRHATGSYLALVNSDVVIHPECLQRLLAFLKARKDVGLVGPKILGGDGCLQRTCRRLPTVWNTLCRSIALDDVFGHYPLFSGREMRHWNHETEAPVEVLSGCFWLARHEAVEDVGGLDERFFFYAEDVDWCKRFWDAGWKVIFFPEATATHFGGGSSANAPLHYAIELLRANLAYWRKHHGRIGQLTFYVLSVLNYSLRLVLLSFKTVVRPGNHHQNAFKLRRSLICVRWLCTGRGA